MNLLSKIQAKLHGEQEDKEPSLEQLNKLPDSEKLKTLEYISALKDLHEPK